MSEITTVNQTSNQVQFDVDQSKVFVYGNKFEGANFINLTGGILSYAVGTVLGRIHATGKVTELKSAATDGSQFPIGILATELTAIAGSGTADINFCNAGEVAEEKVILNGADTLLTVVDARILRDRIAADTMGIKLVLGTELTGFDNQ